MVILGVVSVCCIVVVILGAVCVVVEFSLPSVGKRTIIVSFVSIPLERKISDANVNVTNININKITTINTLPVFSAAIFSTLLYFSFLFLPPDIRRSYCYFLWKKITVYLNFFLYLID